MGDPAKEETTIDLFSNCFGCGKEFKPGDERLRFTLDEWSEHEGMAALGLDVDIGMCADCTQQGDFKTPEVVPGG